MQWYKNTLEQVYAELQTSERGISNHEAGRLLKQYGPNSIKVRKDSLWKIIVEPFRNIFVAVLAVAAAFSLLKGEQLDSVIIISIIVINAVIFYTQQYATNRVLRSLKKHSIQNVRVVRDGRTQTIVSTELVPGDVILLAEGERVAADARLFELENLQVDESALTGESLPVHKKISVFTDETPIYERHNLVMQGTYVVSGAAKAVVVTTGSATEFGKIAELATEKKDKSPVQQKIDQLVSVFIRVVMGGAVIVFALSMIRGIETADAIRFVLAMAVSAVPEGLPVALSVIIVLGMRRMAKKKVLVRTFKAIEDVGLITTIATDKTGTLTKNKLQVIENWVLGKDEIKDYVAKTMDPSDTAPDALDNALKDFAKRVHKESGSQFYGFDITLRMSGTYFPSDKYIYIKGAPEHILDHCKLSKKDRERADSMLHTFASKGYKVIALARHKLKEKPKSLQNVPPGNHEFLGLIALADELRPESRGAINLVQAAGINVKMITGDHYETAYNISRSIDLATKPSQIVMGIDLPKQKAQLVKTVNEASVFARILPEDKFRILQALKTNQIAAMTGDGVNDVPALAGAHVGIAMGSGSDIAKDAGNIVLLDNKFSSIVAALSEGRKIYDNIRRMIFYLLSTSLGEALAMVGALIFALPLPVTAIQILWINLVTDTAMVLPLGLEPAEDGHMQKPPRKPKDPLLSKLLITRIGLVSATMAVITLIIVSVLKSKNYGLDYIQTVAFMALIAAQWANAFNARSESQSLFTRLKRANYALAVGFGAAVFLQALVMFGPLRGVFNIVAVDLGVLGISCLVMVVAVFAVVELHKFIIRQKTT